MNGIIDLSGKHGLVVGIANEHKHRRRIAHNYFARQAPTSRSPI